MGKNKQTASCNGNSQPFAPSKVQFILHVLDSFRVSISPNNILNMDSDLCTIYCGSLSPKVTEEILHELFLQVIPPLS